MSRFFDLTTQSGISHIRFSRPDDLNTFEPDFYTDLRDAVRGLDRAGETRVLIISAAGKHFTAGMALGVFAQMGEVFNTTTPRARDAFRHSLLDLIGCFDVMDQARFPVICAVQGGCIGAGLDLAVACDIRLCTQDAFFALQETQIGMAADLGVLQRLPKLIPAGMARQMAYTSERLPAERALSLGLVNAVLDDADALIDHAMQLARDIAAKSPLAVAGSKQAINYGRDHGAARSLQHMALLQSAIFDPPEMAKAMAAWRDKTQADFADLAALPAMATPDGTGRKSTPALTLDSPLGDLLDDPAARAVLERHLPGIGDHPQIAMARGMPLATVAQFAGGMITDEIIQTIGRDLRNM